MKQKTLYELPARNGNVSPIASQYRLLRSNILPRRAQKQDTQRYMIAVTNHSSKVMRDTAMTSRL